MNDPVMQRAMVSGGCVAVYCGALCLPRKLFESLARKLGLREENLDFDDESVRENDPIQRPTDDVDAVLSWECVACKDRPSVETSLVMPSEKPSRFVHFPCPLDLVYSPYTWNRQEYHIGRVLSVLHSATHSVDICMYMTCAKSLSNHLHYVFHGRKREKKPVPGTVRILLHEPYFADVFGRSRNVTMKKWKRDGVGGGDAAEQHGEMHLKFFVVDKKIAVFGSSNFTLAGYSYNHESNIVTSDERKVKCLLDKFSNLWEHPSAEPFVTERETKYRVPQPLGRSRGWRR